MHQTTIFYVACGDPKRKQPESRCPPGCPWRPTWRPFQPFEIVASPRRIRAKSVNGAGLGWWALQDSKLGPRDDESPAPVISSGHNRRNRKALWHSAGYQEGDWRPSWSRIQNRPPRNTLANQVHTRVREVGRASSSREGWVYPRTSCRQCVSTGLSRTAGRRISLRDRSVR